MEKILLVENEKLKQDLLTLKNDLFKTKVNYDVQTSHLKRLIDLTSILNTSLDLNDVLILFFRYISNIFCFDRAIFLFFQGIDSYEYEIENKDGEISIIPLNKEHYLQLEKFYEHMKRSKKYIVFKDTSDLMNFRDCDIEAFIGVPILYNSIFSGKMFLTSKKKDVYTEKEGKVAFDLINHVITFIENAILFEKMNEMSIRDSLTGIYNRRYFFEFAGKELLKSKRNKKKLVLMMADIDYFKSVNDKKGHVMGDKVLKEVSEILKKTLRGTDVLARYGGEEFIVLLPETEEKEALHVAERIRSDVENKNIKNLNLTLSFGLTIYNGNSEIENIDELIEESDKALYIAKSKGRNRVEVFRGEYQ